MCRTRAQGPQLGSAQGHRARRRQEKHLACARATKAAGRGACAHARAHTHLSSCASKSSASGGAPGSRAASRRARPLPDGTPATSSTARTTASPAPAGLPPPLRLLPPLLLQPIPPPPGPPAAPPGEPSPRPPASPQHWLERNCTLPQSGRPATSGHSRGQMSPSRCCVSASWPMSLPPGRSGASPAAVRAPGGWRAQRSQARLPCSRRGRAVRWPVRRAAPPLPQGACSPAVSPTHPPTTTTIRHTQQLGKHRARRPDVHRGAVAG